MRGRTPQYQCGPQFPHLAKSGWLFPPGSPSSGRGFRKGKATGQRDWLQPEPLGTPGPGRPREPRVLPRTLGRWLLCLQTARASLDGLCPQVRCRLPPPLGSHPGGGGGEPAAAAFLTPVGGESPAAAWQTMEAPPRPHSGAPGLALVWLEFPEGAVSELTFRFSDCPEKLPMLAPGLFSPFVGSTAPGFIQSGGIFLSLESNAYCLENGNTLERQSSPTLAPSSPPPPAAQASVHRSTCLVAQSCLSVCDPVDCSPPGSSVHGVLQATLLEWVAVSFSRGSS